MRLAVFDLDGTLIDSREDICRAVNHALLRLGLPQRSMQEVAGFVGEGARRLVERAVAPHEELVERGLAAWFEHYEAHLLDHTTLFPGMAAVLASARCALAVHTNKPGRLARRILDGLGVAGRFAAVVGGDEAPRKPDPTGTLEIMARVGARADETVLVGDSRIDLETAAAAGLRFVGVTWGLVPTAALAEAGATVFAQTAADLLPWVAAA